METAGMPYYHAIIGDVDIKTKIVAPGCPGEAVTVHCSRYSSRHGHHLPWNTETELQAREILSWIGERFSTGEYKMIPVPTPQGLGMKIHCARTIYEPATYNPQGGKAEASPQTQDIFRAVREVIEQNNNGDRVYVPQRNDGHVRLTEHGLRRELARIIRSDGHVESKVRDIVRLMGA